MTTEGAAVSEAHIVACARNLLEHSKTVLDDKRNLSISKDAIDPIHDDVHLAFTLLTRRYNSQVPVNQLHPELLGMVFHHLRAPAKVFNPKGLHKKPTFDSYKPLIHAMMVCHKWLAVASEMASLWTDVDYSRSGDRPSRLLKRSGMTPIHLRLNVDGLAGDRAYLHEMVRANAFRLRQLDLCMADTDTMTDTDTMNTAMQLLGNDMPLLRCLKMWYEDYDGNSILRNAQARGRFPSLRGMVLIGHLWLPAPEVGPLTTLTHLHVSTICNKPLTELMTFLDAMPALEVLDLHGCLGVTLTELPTHTTTLQHLTHLTIREMYTGVAEVLMSALVLPFVTTVYLWLGVDHDTTRITDAILPQPPFWHDIMRVRIDQDSDVDAYRTLFIELRGDIHRVRLRLFYLDLDLRALWPLPIANLQLAHVSSAHLHIFDWTSLRQFVARVPALASLVVETCEADAATARTMVEALRDVLLQEDSDPVLCPCLREIALISSTAIQGLTECLAPALEKRRRDGRQVRRLRTWIDFDEDNATEPTASDTGDALAEYIGAEEVEHERGPFWPRDEEVWRRESEFWEVPKMWRSGHGVW